MPFTISHAVLAPPISKLTGNRLPIAALAIGCMVPDLYRLFTTDTLNTTHHWQSLIQPNLWIGLFFCVLWYSLYRPVIFRFLGIQDPLKVATFFQFFGFCIAICCSIIIGAATHLIWDGLTHSDFRAFIFKDWLSQSITVFHESVPIHLVLQISTSVIALPFLVWMCWHYYQKYQQYTPVSSTIKCYVISLFLISISFGLFNVWSFIQKPEHQKLLQDWYEITGRLLNQFFQGGLIIFSCGCLLFLLLTRFHKIN